MLLNRRLTSIFYISDALIKEQERLGAPTRSAALDGIMNSVEWSEVPYPYQVAVLRLTACSGYERPELARGIVNRQRVVDNYFFLREVVSLSYSVLDRSTIKGLVLDTFPVAPPFLRRAIFCALLQYSRMSADEKRPLIRNMLQYPEDWFLKRMEATYRKPTEVGPASLSLTP